MRHSKYTLFFTKMQHLSKQLVEMHELFLRLGGSVFERGDPRAAIRLQNVERRSAEILHHSNVLGTDHGTLPGKVAEGHHCPLYQPSVHYDELPTQLYRYSGFALGRAGACVEHVLYGVLPPGCALGVRSFPR